MRGAGCTYNDIVDKDYDASVARTAARPIPSGQVSVAEAQMFLAVLCIAGFVILIQLNTLHHRARGGLARARRHLSLHEAVHLLAADRAGPDVQVGRAGRLVGRHRLAVARRRSRSTPAACCGPSATTPSMPTRTRRTTCSSGLKSTALRLGEATPRWLVAFYAGAVVLWGLAGAMAGARLAFFLALALVAVQLAWQIATLECGRSGQLPCPLQVQSAGRLAAARRARRRHGPRRARRCPLLRQRAGEAEQAEARRDRSSCRCRRACVQVSANS